MMQIGARRLEPRNQGSVACGFRIRFTVIQQAGDGVDPFLSPRAPQCLTQEARSRAREVVREQCRGAVHDLPGFPLRAVLGPGIPEIVGGPNHQIVKRRVRDGLRRRIHQPQDRRSAVPLLGLIDP